MRLRLAFSVAAHLTADVLIVDEVLAVGDAEFQKKCMGVIREGDSLGRTTLFVSHNMTAVRNICSRVAWMEAGAIRSVGPADEMSRAYLRSVDDGDHRGRWKKEGVQADAEPGLLSACVGDGNGDSFAVGEVIPLSLEFQVPASPRNLHVTVMVVNEDGVVVLASMAKPVRESDASTPEVEVHLARTELPATLLNSGSYSASLLLVENGTRVIEQVESALAFSVVEKEERGIGWYGKWPGVVRPELEWTVSKLEKSHD
ncbi:MAG: hypothetical protein ACYTDX_06745, partial [Planctomycetota bacterium]|jgi:lipopolysaccharide transport system ATP-binding protein